MRIGRGVGLVFVLGCAPAPDSGDPLGADRGERAPVRDEVVFSPRDVWRVGQRWRTIWLPLEQILYDLWPREYELEYEVISHDSEGTSILVIYRALHGSREPLVNPEILQFDATGALLHSGMPRLREWPVFPLDAARDEVRREGDLFILTSEREADRGVTKARYQTRVQWQVGQPWYDRAQVNKDYSSTDETRWRMWEAESTIEFSEAGVP